MKTLFSNPPQPDAPNHESAELRMRRALGLTDDAGAAVRPRPEPARPKLELPSSDHRPAGTRPRQRFVQDGEVPVTLVSRQHEPDAAARSSASRPVRADAGLTQEQAARRQAERSLQQAQAMLHDLRTKLGHAELARQEAVEAAKAERLAAEALRAEFRAQEVRLSEALEAEKTARLAAEAALQKALAVRENANRAAAPAARSAPARQRVVKPAADAATSDAATAAAAPARKPRKSAASQQREPQPVKWWLRSGGKH
jgi:hypothetical protein